MKKLKIWSIMMLITMALPMMVACGGDDGESETVTNKVVVDGKLFPVIEVENGGIGYYTDLPYEDYPKPFRIYLDKGDLTKHYIVVSVTPNLNGIKRELGDNARDTKNQFDFIYYNKAEGIKYSWNNNWSHKNNIEDGSFLRVTTTDYSNIEIEFDVKYRIDGKTHSISGYFNGTWSPGSTFN